MTTTTETPQPEIKTFYRGWKIQAAPGRAKLSRRDGERFYARTNGLPLPDVLAFCKRKIDRMESGSFINPGGESNALQPSPEVTPPLPVTLSPQVARTAPEPKKRKYTRRAKKTDPGAVTLTPEGKRRLRLHQAVSGVPAAGEVELTPEQLSKLWEAVTGGTIAVETNGSGPIFRVSLSSFERALPVLLEKL